MTVFGCSPQGVADSLHQLFPPTISFLCDLDWQRRRACCTVRLLSEVVVGGHMSLSTTDLRSALDVIDPAQVDEPGEPLPWTMLEGLAVLVGADGACYVEQDPYAERMLVGQDTQPNPASEELEEWYWELFWKCAACSNPQRSGDFTSVTLASDFYSKREFARHPMSEYAATTGFNPTVLLPLPPHGLVDRRLLFYRDGRPFGERERLLLTLLRPHIVTLHTRVVARAESAGRDQLTPRQLELLRLVAAGYSNRQIARRLRLADGTVRKHLENIYTRLGVTSRTAAIARAFPVDATEWPPSSRTAAASRHITGKTVSSRFRPVAGQVGERDNLGYR